MLIHLNLRETDRIFATTGFGVVLSLVFCSICAHIITTPSSRSCSSIGVCTEDIVHSYISPFICRKLLLWKFFSLKQIFRNIYTIFYYLNNAQMYSQYINLLGLSISNSICELSKLCFSLEFSSLSLETSFLSDQTESWPKSWHLRRSEEASLELPRP